MRELVKPHGARAVIIGTSEPDYLAGIPGRRIAADLAGVARRTAFFQRANLDLQARWTGAGWPTDYWAGQVYPDLPALDGKRRLAQDLLRFCRLTDADGKGSSGWLADAPRSSRGSASPAWSSAAPARRSTCGSRATPGGSAARRRPPRE
jgi:hypothetical protein